MAEPKTTAKPRVVCCVGDIHGYISNLQNLWSNLEIAIGSSDFQTALVIFLGDYCDRGPDTKKVIDFLISLYGEGSKVAALSGRKDVWNIPVELCHHGKVHIDGFTLIIDQGGGLEANPVAALVLPSRKLVLDADKFTK